MADHEAVLDFWFGEVGPERWFARDDALDAEMARRFGELRARIVERVPDDWLASARGTLAAIIVLDQFGRNVHRDDARAFAADPAARALALDAIAQGLDQRLSERERQFLYMPLMHSERLADVERCVALMAGFDDDEPAAFARRHAETVRRFGRYPARNAALGRESTPAEAAFLAANPDGF